MIILHLEKYVRAVCRYQCSVRKDDAQRREDFDKNCISMTVIHRVPIQKIMAEIKVKVKVNLDLYSALS